MPFPCQRAISNPWDAVSRRDDDEISSVRFLDGGFGHGAQKINIASPCFDDAEICAVGAIGEWGRDSRPHFAGLMKHKRRGMSTHHPVRIVKRDGEPWFVAADVCKAMAISNPLFSGLMKSDAWAIRMAL